jgi:hypothetical protein
MAGKMFALALLVTIAVIAGCVGQQPPEQRTLYNLTKDGIEYVFSNDIYKALDVPIYDKARISEELMSAQRIWILFTNDTADNAYVAIASSELTSKLVHYYAYTQTRLVKASGVELSELNATVQGTLIEFRGPNTGANATDVHIDGVRIIVQALNASELRLVADRLALVLFEDDLLTMGIDIPRSSSQTTASVVSGFDYGHYNPPEAEINYSLLLKWPIVKSPMQYYVYNNTEINPYAYNMTLDAIQSAFEEWENATQRKVLFEQVDGMPTEGIAIEIVPSLRADVIGEASSHLVHEYGNYTLIAGGNMAVAPQYGLYRIVLIHEIGHIIGLGHSKNPHSVMYQYAEPSQEITPDVLEALGILYQDIPATS